MAMSKGVRVGTITIGCSLLALTFVSMICGSVAMRKMSSPIAVSVGIWGLYFATPGIFSVLAGYKKQSSLLAVALGTHVLGIVLAIVGLYFGASFWARLASNCADSYSYSYNSYDGYYSRRIKRDGYCFCLHNDTHAYTYPVSCSDLKTVREATGAVTIFFALFAIVTLVGSIYGCIAWNLLCTTSKLCLEPTVIVTTGQQPNTIMITTQAHSACNQQPLVPIPMMTTQAYPAYSQVSQQPPSYDPMVVDSKAC